MVKTTYNSSEEMIIKLQLVKGKTKLKFYKSINNYYDEMNFRRQSGVFHFEEDTFSNGVQGIGQIYHEALLIMNFLQTKPSVRNLILNY